MRNDNDTMHSYIPKIWVLGTNVCHLDQDRSSFVQGHFHELVPLLREFDGPNALCFCISSDHILTRNVPKRSQDNRGRRQYTMTVSVIVQWRD